MSYRVRAWHYNYSHLIKRPFSTKMVPNADKLRAVRAQFPKHQIGVYVVLTQDEHNSEYTSEADNRREFISEFTGSAGTAVITSKEAALATDGRYFLQAGKQLTKDWELLKQGVKGVPTWQEYAVNKALDEGTKIGVDPKLITYDQVQALYQALEKRDAPKDTLKPVSDNLIDNVWGAARPSRSDAQVSVLSDDYTGKNFVDKVKGLQREIAKNNGTAFVVSALDEIAWLFNLRGADIAFNPVFFAYAIVSRDETNLYIDDVKVTEKARGHLGDSVTIKPYQEVFNDAQNYAQSLVNLNEKALKKQKLLAPKGCSWALVEALGGEDNVSIIPSPVEVAKGAKNEVEVEGARLAHVKDGVAITRYLAWLGDALEKGENLSDYDGAQKCLEFRKQMDNFKGLSFETISSSGPNAAVIHYSPAEDSEYMIKKDQVYLLDSGGQYLEGTTDTTRTHHYGTPSDKEKQAYTLVLKGHIALANAVFPEGSNGYMLDTLARQHLWKYGLDYRHGTGHGIGAFLNVHEGPIGVGFRQGYREAPFQIGNVLSNEPGYYEDGEYGIRIESVVVVKKSETPYNFGGTNFFEFETITQVPLCKNLMDMTLLSTNEKSWIDNYHKSVFNTIKDYFSPDESAFTWLKKETSPIVV